MADARIAATSARLVVSATCRRARQWTLSPDAAYVHVTANETIHGVEFQISGRRRRPADRRLQQPIASRAHRHLALRRSTPARRRTLGPVGIAVLIVRRDLLARSGQPRAPIFDSPRFWLEAESMLQHPAGLNWYMLGTVNGCSAGRGRAVCRTQTRKTALLYAAIDDPAVSTATT